MSGRRGEGEATRGRRRALLTALLIFAALGSVGLLVFVAIEGPEVDAPRPDAPEEQGPQLAPPRPVRPFVVDGARALPASLPPLPAVDLTPGRLPELQVRGIDTRDEGHVTWLDDPVHSDILIDASLGRSDGASLYYTSGNHRDLLIRGGEVYTDVLRQLGLEFDDRRCWDLRAGRLLLVGAVGDALDAWLFDQSGPIQRIDLGISAAQTYGCAAYLREDGGFVVQADARAIWDGERITHAVAANPLRTSTRFNTSAACAPACSPHERAPTTSEFAERMESALACEDGVSYQLAGPWLVGRCSAAASPVARAALDGPCCDHALLPAQADLAAATLTRAGDVVLSYRDGTIALWTLDGVVGPRTTVAAVDFMSHTTPALLLRGLPWARAALGAHGVARPPWAGMPWLDRAVGGGGYDADAVLRVTKPAPSPRRTPSRVASDFVSSDTRDAAASAFGAEIDLYADRLHAVDLRCGHVVWVTEELQLGGLYTYLRSSTRSPKCRRLADFAAIAGDHARDALIARDPRGELLLAWQPPDPIAESTWELSASAFLRVDAPADPPFSGWIPLGFRGAPDDGNGWGRVPAVTSVRVGDRRLIIEDDHVYTLPLDSEPLSVDRNGGSLLAAHGERVILCAPRCVSFDPGLGRPVTAASLLSTSPPRVLLRDGDAYGLLHPDAPREELPEHPLAATLRELFARRDREHSEFRSAFAAWAAKVKAGTESELDPAKLRALEAAFDKVRGENDAKRPDAKRAGDAQRATRKAP